MAVAHVVYVDLVRVGVPDGKIYHPTDNTRSIKQSLQFTTEHRIVPDSSVPNSTGYPTIKAYIEAEAAGGFVLSHMNQYMIVTTKP